MKKTRVLEYDIFGSAISWPVEVDLSRDEETGEWELSFEYVGPDAEDSREASSTDAEVIYYALEENHAPILDFADSVQNLAENSESPELQESLLGLADSLRSLENSN